MENKNDPPNDRQGGPERSPQQTAPGRDKANQPKTATANPKANHKGKQPLEWLIFAFVILTFLATATAAWYTRRQWVTADDSEKRSLRAYVLVSKSEIRDFGSDRPISGVIELRNGGPTPAFDLRRHVRVFAGPFPLPSSEIPDLKVGGDQSILGPNSDVDLGPFTLTTILNASQIANIRERTWAIYVFGVLTYVDAFGTLRCTRINLLFQGNAAPVAAGGIMALSHAEQGNGADEHCAELLPDTSGNHSAASAAP